MNTNTEPPQLPAPGGTAQLGQQPFKFRRVNEITGTFVLLVVAALIAAVVWTGHSQRWFKSSVTLRIVLPADGAAGIRQGSEIYFLGTLVGSVSDVVVAPTGLMEAQAHIRRDFFRFVRTDSSAVVKKKFGVAGDSFFEITRGHGQPLPEKDASIPCTEQFQSALESAIDEIHQEALTVLRKTSAGLETWNRLGAHLDESRVHLDNAAINLEKVTAAIEAGHGTLGKLVTSPALADQTQTLLARATETLDKLQIMVTNLNLASGNIQSGTTRLPEITDAVAQGANGLPALVLQTRSSMVEVERLVEALQKQWLIRKYVNHTNPPPLDPSSSSIGHHRN